MNSHSMSLIEIEKTIAALNGTAKAYETALKKTKKEQNQIILKPIEFNTDITLLESEIEKLDKKINNLTGNIECPEISESQTEMYSAEKSFLISKLKQAKIKQNLSETQIKNINDKLAFQTRTLSRAKKIIEIWEDIRKSRLTDVVYEELRQNNETLKQLNSISTEKININFLKKIAERNISIANKLIDIKRKKNAAEKDLNILKEREELLKKDYLSTQKRIDMMGLTEKTGLLLQTKRATLQTSNADPSIAIKRSNNIVNTNLESDELVQETQQYLPFKDSTYQQLDNLERRLSKNENDILTTNAFLLLESYRKLLEECSITYNNYLQILNNQISIQKEIDIISEKFRNYINQRLLWTSSSAFYNVSYIINSKEAISWLFAKKNLIQLSNDIKSSFKQKPEIWVLLIIMLLVSIMIQFYLPGLTAKINRFATVPKNDTIARTLITVTLTVIQAFSIPLAVYLSAVYISSVATASFYTKALCYGIISASIIAAFTNLILSICKKNGIGEKNLTWPAEICKYCRNYFLKLGIISTVFIFIISTIQNAPQNLNLRSSFGRSAMIIFLIITALCLISGIKSIKKYRRIRTSQVDPYTSNNKSKKKNKWLYIVFIGIPILLIILTIAGYYFTAYELGKNIIHTVIFLFILFLIYKILQRIILIAHIHISIKKEKNKQLVRKQNLKNESNIIIKEDDKIIEAETLTKQTTQLMLFFFIIFLIIGFIYIWQNIFPSFSFLNNICIWNSKTINPENGQTFLKQITLLNFFQALLIFLVTFFIVKNISAIIEISIFRGKKIHPGTIYSFELISKYLISCTGLFLGLKIIGIGWAQFQYIAAAMTLGLSFGLQDIFANFVSGIIILFERPIRIGDTVTIGDSEGIVSKMHIRSTTVTNWDRHELIIPNKSFLSEKIINWSLTDKIIRIVINVGISYDSQARLAEKVLMEIAESNPEVLESPPPSVIFTGFGSNSLDFCLRVFVSLEHQISVQHNIRHEINRRFKESGIKQPFTQRDIHISPKEAPLRVSIVNNNK